MLLVCFGIESLLNLGSVTFPSSVAGLIILFLALLLSERVLGEHRTRRIVSVIEVPVKSPCAIFPGGGGLGGEDWLTIPQGGWSLRWISMLFTPAFVLLPLSPPIGVVEVFKIIAVFSKSHTDTHTHTHTLPLRLFPCRSSDHIYSSVVGFVVMMVLTAYMTRSLQLVFGSSKRAMTKRAEELGRDDNDRIPMTAVPPGSEGVTPTQTPTPGTLSEAPSSLDVPSLAPPPGTRSRPASGSTPGVSRLRPPPGADDDDDDDCGGGGSSGGGGGDTARPLPPQAPPPPRRSGRWAAAVAGHLDLLTYGALFLLVGLPAYYAGGYAMPMQLSLGVLAYFAALAVPPAWRRFLHPVIVSSLLSVLGLWVLGLARGDGLRASLAQYRTGATYSALWSGGGGAGGPRRPGAGDVVTSALDASIVSLALPMYQYRRELRAHLPAIAVPNVAVSVGTLFAYPPLCRAVGIGAERSLSFTARSLTLALATPAVANLGGDPNTVAALAITSGILGVLVGQRMLAFLRIPEGEFPSSSGSGFSMFCLSICLFACLFVCLVFCLLACLFACLWVS